MLHSANKTDFSALRSVKIILLCSLSLYSFRLFISTSPNFIWIILFLALLFFFARIKTENQKKSVIISSGILGFIFSLMFFLSNQLNLNEKIYFDPHSLICSLCLSVFFFHTLAGVYSILLNLNNNSGILHLSKKDKLIILFILSFILLLFWLPYLIACFPGNLTSDNIGEIRQQLGLSPLSNHHPIIHQFMIKICLLPGIIFGSVKIGVILFIILQTIITAFIFSYCIVYMLDRNTPPLLLLFAFLFYALFTINGFYTVTMYKDVPFSGITLLLMITLIKELNGNFSSGSMNKRILSLILLIALSFLFCTLRNNGYYAFIIGFPLLILFNLKDIKRLLIIFIITFILVNSYNYILFNIHGVKKPSSGEMLGLPLQMIARVITLEDPDIKQEEFQIIQEVIPNYETLSAKYIPNNSDPIKGNGVFLPEVFDKNPQRYLKSWLKIGLQYPRTYIDAFLLHTQSFWDPNKEYSSISPYIYENEFGLSQSKRTEPLRVFLINMHLYLADHSIFSPFYSTGFMIILFIFSFSLLVLKGQFQEASPIFLLAALWATAIAAPYCLYQYIYGLTVTIPLFFFLALALPSRQQASTSYGSPV